MPCSIGSASGETLVLTNFSLFGEGLDLAMAKCIILARPTKSWILAMQMCGRGLRPWNGETCVFLDHGLVIRTHGLPDAERDYSLTTTKPREVVPALRTCKFCYAIWEPPRATCPQCGQAPAQVEREGPEQVDGVEVDIRGATKRADMEEFKRELIQICIDRGFRGGYLVHRFLERFPGAPKPWKAYREVEAKRTATQGAT